MKDIFSGILSKILSKKILLIAASGVLIIAISFVLIFTACQNNKETTSNTGLEAETPPETTSAILENETDYDEDTYEEDFFDEYEDETDSEGSTRDPNYNKSAEPKKYYSYLTGVRVSRTKQRKRPVSIIINNLKAAMPNIGISRADIIYECIAEGGITRLMMILADYENAPVFGSVRSSREYFIDLSRSHDTIYVHAGGNPQDYTEFSKRTIDRIDGVNMNFPNTFFRDSERRKTMSLEHTLMTSGEGIVAGIKQQDYRTTLESDYKGAFNFYEVFTDIGGNNTANYVCVPYTNAFKPEFIYNSEDNLYYRKQFGEAHIDGETGEQIKFENVIVIFAEYTPFRETEIARKEGHLACNLTGSGYGFYISGGKYKIIKWQKETRNSPLNLLNSDKSELFLNPGKSFICVTSTEYNKSVVINAEIKDIK